MKNKFKYVVYKATLGGEVLGERMKYSEGVWKE